MTKLIGESRNPEQRRKKHNMECLKLRIKDCNTLEDLFVVLKQVEALWHSGDIYKYAYHCLRDAILDKENELVDSMGLIEGRLDNYEQTI